MNSVSFSQTSEKLFLNKLSLSLPGGGGLSKVSMMPMCWGQWASQAPHWMQSEALLALFHRVLIGMLGAFRLL